MINEEGALGRQLHTERSPSDTQKNVVFPYIGNQDLGLESDYEK